MSKQRQNYAQWHISTKYDPKRKELSIHKCHIIDYSYLKALVDMKLPIRSLSLAKNKLKSNDFSALSQSEWLKLEELQLHFNCLNNEGAYILSSMKMPNLINLDLSSCGISGIGMKYLVQAKLPLLVHLSLGFNKIGVQGSQSLSVSQWPLIRKINLYGNCIKNEGLKFLIRSNWKKIQQILLDDNNLTQEGIQQLCNSMWEDISYLGISIYHLNKNLTRFPNNKRQIICQNLDIYIQLTELREDGFDRYNQFKDWLFTIVSSAKTMLIDTCTDYQQKYLENFQSKKIKQCIVPLKEILVFQKLILLIFTYTIIQCALYNFLMSKIFYQKWDQVYRIVKRKLGFAVTEQTLFGPIESFDKKKIGPYHLIKNISYAQKKGSTMVNKTREENNIQLPFIPDKFHFTLMPYFQTVAFVDLDNGRLIIPHENQNQERLQEHEYQTQHIIKISKSHIAHGHSIYVPYLRQHLPQILTPRLIEATIKLSGILPGQKIGYNSQGGGSTVNHFHAQLIDGSSLLNKNQFHFQSMQGQRITTLIADLQGSDSTSKIEISSFEHVSALYIRISSKQYKIFDRAILKSIVKAVWTIADIALTNNIPHNLNIPNQHQVYVILRNFAENDMRYGWVEFSGVQIITNDYDFEHITAEEIAQRYAKLALPKEILEGKFKKSASK